VTETPQGPDPGEKRAALQEVLQSRSFERSSQLQAFLRFVCEKEIAGRAGELSEHLIGVEALGRPPGYSPAEDSVVRRRAIDLREKLQDVYANELAAARLRIELPKGRYVPRFVRVAEAAVPSVSLPAVERPAPAPSRWKGPGLAFAAFLAGLALGAAGAAYRWRATAPASAARGVSYEAEDAASVLHGMAVRDRCEACSGGGRVRNIGRTPANYVAFSDVRVAEDGHYLLTIHFVLDGQRGLSVHVNDGAAVDLPLKGHSWVEPAEVTIVVPLRAGANTIRFFNDRAVAPDLDRIELW
jgi:hypothetical protein